MTRTEEQRRSCKCGGQGGVVCYLWAAAAKGLCDVAFVQGRPREQPSLVHGGEGACEDGAQVGVWDGQSQERRKRGSDHRAQSQGQEAVERAESEAVVVLCEHFLGRRLVGCERLSWRWRA